MSWRLAQSLIQLRKQTQVGGNGGSGVIIVEEYY
jgi:hypothetical protein